MKKFLLLSSLVVVSSLVAADGAALYSKCVSCHGEKGEKTQFAKIQGLTKEDIATKLKGYRDGNGGAKKAMMVPQAKGLDEAAITTLADYISKF